MDIDIKGSVWCHGAYYVSTTQLLTLFYSVGCLSIAKCSSQILQEFKATHISLSVFTYPTIQHLGDNIYF